MGKCSRAGERFKDTPRGYVGAVFCPAGDPGVTCESAAGFQRSGLQMYLPGLEFWVRCRVLDLMLGPCSEVLKNVSVCRQLTSCSSMRFNKPPGMEQIF